ncbi:hormogonium polysaccharide biosynthesis protein HpsL [Floridanema aerugineum]|uniref:Hormogonium polysaccharide biosynthesis protein HpsL n=1 Tax=Floridaenema aerugineum BLCC-F46 TaxID=3153654 RepID=A0ABV4X541_9CYAN
MRKLKSKRKSKKQDNATETITVSLKEQLIQKRKAAQAKKEFISFTSSVLFLAIFLGLLLFPVGGIKASLAAFGGIFCMIMSFKYPRQALWAFMFYVPFGGTVVYALAGGNALFQLAKDGFYIPAVVTIYQECKRKRLPFLIPDGLKTSLFFLLAVCVLTLLLVNGAQQFGPACSSLPRGARIPCRDGQPILLGILGLKVLLGYLPLITCAFYLIRSKRELLFLTRTNTVLAIVCCALGFIQYYFLTSGRCAGTRGFSGDALFKATLEARCLVGGSLVFSPEVGMIRLPGTFVSPWHWAWYLISGAFLTFATAFSDPAPLWRITGLVGMLAVLVNAVISGQRIALALVPLVFIILLVLTGQLANLKRFLPIAAGVAVAVTIGTMLFPDLVQERVDSFIGRWNAAPPTDFIAAQAENSSKKSDGFFGQGLGRATNSARAFGNVDLIETYYPKILHEIGPLGLLGFLGLVTSLTYFTFKAYRSVKEPNLRSFAASFWVFVLVISYNTYWYPLDTDPVAVYYWFFAGVILKLPQIDKEEREKLKATEVEDPKSKKKKKVKKKV